MAYSQQDGRWGGQLLGYNTDRNFNLANYGCLVTAVSNLMTVNGDDTTPAVVNNQFKVNGGFQPGGGIMYWTAPPQLNPAIQDHGFVGTLAETNNWLKDGPNYAIIEVRTRAGGQHFVLGNLVNTIIDSEDGVQKNILTYAFYRARLYTWLTPGRGSVAPTPITPPAPITSNNGEPIMTAEEEANAYQIVLGRTDENPGSAPRTGYQFILDARGELNAQRSAAGDKLAEANAATQAAQATAVSLQATADRLTAELAAKDTVVPPAAPEAPTAPTQPTEIAHQITRVAIADGTMVDYGGEGLPSLPINAGTVFHQYSTFATPDGSRQVRTQKSKDDNHWYGTSESLFDPVVVPTPDLTKTDAVHLGASKLVGSIGKWFYNLFHKHN